MDIYILGMIECCKNMDKGLSRYMRIFLTGACCVGKTTIGEKMGELLGIRFFDLDCEIESFFGNSIERLQKQFFRFNRFVLKPRKRWSIY